jgi:putative transposase
MCRVLGVNRTSLHDWERRPPSDRALSDAWLTEKIKQIQAASRGVYGAPRIHAELRLEHAIRVGRKRVARLMKAAGISAVKPRKRWRTTIRAAATSASASSGRSRRCSRSPPSHEADLGVLGEPAPEGRRRRRAGLLACLGAEVPARRGYRRPVKFKSSEHLPI